VNLAVLIPYYAADTEEGRCRQAVWDYLRPRWAETGFDFLVATDPLVGEGRPFSVARATNHAAAYAPDHIDAFITFGADHVPDVAVLRWAEAQLRWYSWTRVYEFVSYANHTTTWSLLAGTLSLDTVVWPAATAAPCPGVVAVHRSRWDAVQGYDEAYEGWGYEDTDLVRRLRAMSPGGQAKPAAVLRELWHPTGSRDLTDANPNQARFLEKWGSL
jgi:hypothetical protein